VLSILGKGRVNVPIETRLTRISYRVTSGLVVVVLIVAIAAAVLFPKSQVCPGLMISVSSRRQKTSFNAN
jgi:hypothetical protein